MINLNYILDIKDCIEVLWFPWWKRDFEPNLKSANALERAIDQLMKIQEWLASDHEAYIRLWHVVDYLRKRRLAFLSLYGNNVRNRLFALRQLTQLDEGEAVNICIYLCEQYETPLMLKQVAEEYLIDFDRQIESGNVQPVKKDEALDGPGIGGGQTDIISCIKHGLKTTVTPNDLIRFCYDHEQFWVAYEQCEDADDYDILIETLVQHARQTSNLEALWVFIGQNFS